MDWLATTYLPMAIIGIFLILRIEIHIIFRLAEAELLRESKRAAIRYDIAGPSGWRPCPLNKTNKRFLVNTIRQTLSSNKLKEQSKTKVTPKKRKLYQGRNAPGYCKDNIVFKSPSKSKKNEDKKEDGNTKSVKRENSKRKS